MNRSYTFLWSPKWLSLTVLVAGLVVTMLWLASWQFDRLDERRAENAAMDAGLSEDPRDLASILSDPGAIHAFTHTTAEGEYLPGSQIWVQGRSLDDNPGLWLLAPFKWSSGETIMVVRGWVPVTRVTPIKEAPPGGTVSLIGVLIPGEVQRNVGPQDRVNSGLFTRVDLEIMGEQLGLALGVVYLQLTTPDVSNGPIALSAPVVDGEGPHKGYALQWIGFSLTAVVGLGALVRNEAGKQAGSA
jgi:cytochrome oxidase assembly protein ShyY1